MPTSSAQTGLGEGGSAKMSRRQLALRSFLRQAATIAVTLLGLLVLTFVIGRLMPADPVRAIVGEDATRETYEQVFRQLGSGLIART